MQQFGTIYFVFMRNKIKFKKMQQILYFSTTGSHPLLFKTLIIIKRQSCRFITNYHNIQLSEVVK